MSKSTKTKRYTTVFSSIVKCVVGEEKDLILSKASLDKIKSFIPDIDTSKNHDLLPISFNACVVNRVNKNGDAITTATAIDIYKTFIYKSINVEHNRQKSIGVILTAGFSEFGTDEPLSLDDVKDLDKPFNITLGGVIWRNINKDVADLVEDSADPSSENYLKISASWELGYTGFSLALVEGDSKNLEGATLITDEKEVEEKKENLMAFGGTGKIEDKNIYRVPSDGVIAIGIGLTENPAAEVVGIAVETPKEKEIEEDIEESSSSLKLQKDEIIFSQKENQGVNDYSDMKITSLKDITDESLKTVKASAVTDFIEEKIKEADKAFLSEKESRENAEKLHKESLAKNQEDLETANSQISEMKKELEKLQSLISAKQNEEILSARMAEFDSEYDLDDEDRQVLAGEIKGLNDEVFAEYKKKTAVFFKNRKKSKAGKEKEEVKASVTDKQSEDSVLGEALDKVTAKTPPVPNTPNQETSQKDRWAKAFSPENVLIKKR